MRGQVSVFMVLAVLIVFLAALLALLQQSGVPAERIITGTNEHSQKLRNVVQSCFEESVQQSLLMFGLQGGYITPRAAIDSLEVDGFLVPFYVYGKATVIPDPQMLRDAQLSSSVESGLLDCFNQFRDFQYPVEFSSPRVVTAIAPGSISFSLDMPARIGVGDQVVVVDSRYGILRNSRLDKTVGFARRIASDPDASSGMVDLALLKELTDDNYNVSVLSYDDDDFFYVITDNVDKVYDMPFRYQFGVRVSRS